MRTVVLGPRPAELDALIARRHALGLDGHDEVWEGEYHMAPAAWKSHGYLQLEVAAALRHLTQRAGLSATAEFNLGTPDDFRIPDLGYHRSNHDAAFVPTVAIAVEVLSPDDETWAKLDFYAAHGVDEVLVVDGAERTVTWLVLAAGGYERAAGSRLLGLETRDLARRVEWPPLDPVPPPS